MPIAAPLGNAPMMLIERNGMTEQNEIGIASRKEETKNEEKSGG